MMPWSKWNKDVHSNDHDVAMMKSSRDEPQTLCTSCTGRTQSEKSDWPPSRSGKVA